MQAAFDRQSLKILKSNGPDSSLKSFRLEAILNVQTTNLKENSLNILK